MLIDMSGFETTFWGLTALFGIIAIYGYVVVLRFLYKKPEPELIPKKETGSVLSNQDPYGYEFLIDSHEKALEEQKMGHKKARDFILPEPKGTPGVHINPSGQIIYGFEIDVPTKIVFFEENSKSFRFVERQSMPSHPEI